MRRTVTDTKWAQIGSPSTPATPPLHQKSPPALCSRRFKNQSQLVLYPTNPSLGTTCAVRLEEERDIEEVKNAVIGEVSGARRRCCALIYEIRRIAQYHPGVDAGHFNGVDAFGFSVQDKVKKTGVCAGVEIPVCEGDAVFVPLKIGSRWSRRLAMNGSPRCRSRSSVGAR